MHAGHNIRHGDGDNVMTNNNYNYSVLPTHTVISAWKQIVRTVLSRRTEDIKKKKKIIFTCFIINTLDSHFSSVVN